MQCNCISKTEKKFTDHMTEQLGVTAKAECKATAFVLSGNSMDLTLVIPFQITADKPGFKKGKAMNMTVNYCPFCGAPAKAAPAKPTEATAS